MRATLRVMSAPTPATTAVAAKVRTVAIFRVIPEDPPSMTPGFQWLDTRQVVVERSYEAPNAALRDYRDLHPDAVKVGDVLHAVDLVDGLYVRLTAEFYPIGASELFRLNTTEDTPA